MDIGDLSGDDVAGFDGLIIGAPTWHTGADTERSGTAWDDFIYGDLAGLDLKGKKVPIAATSPPAPTATRRSARRRRFARPFIHPSHPSACLPFFSGRDLRPRRLRWLQRQLLRRDG